MSRFLSAAFTLVLCLPLHGAELVATPAQRISVPQLTDTIHDMQSPAIASAGSHALSVWNDRRLTQLGSLFATRLSAEGAILDPFGIMLDAEVGLDPHVAWNGTDYIAIAGAHEPSPYPYAYRERFAYRVAPNGTLIGSRTALGRIELVKLASNGREIALTGSSPTESFIALLDKTGRIRTRASLGDRFTTARAVADGNDWFVFVGEQTCGNLTCDYDLNRYRLDANGQPTDKVRVMPKPDQWGQSAIASNGDGTFLLSWAGMPIDDPTNSTYSLEVWYAIVDRDGKLLKNPGLVEKTLYQRNHFGILEWSSPIPTPALQWNRDQFVLAWPWHDGTGHAGMRSMRIGTDGQLLDASPVRFSELETRHIATSLIGPAVAVTDSRLLVQWGVATTPNPVVTRSTSLLHRAVRSTSELADGTTPTRLSHGSSSQTNLGLTAGDDSILATWTEGSSVLARVLPFAGAGSSTLRVSDGTREPYGVVAHWGGGLYLVAWREDIFNAQGQPMDNYVFLRRFDRHGNALDAAPIELAHEFFSGKSYLPGMTPGIAWDGTQFLVTWGGVDDRRIHASRVRADGTVVDRPTALRLSTGPTVRPGSPRPVWTGSEFAVVWYEDPTLADGPLLPPIAEYARLTRLRSNGTIVDDRLPKIITVPTWFAETISPFQVATNGAELFVTWGALFSLDPGSRRGCAYSQRFTLQGTPIDSQPVEVRCQNEAVWFSGDGGPRVMWTGAEWMYVYQLADSDAGIYAVAVKEGRPAGTILEIVGGEHGPRNVAAVQTSVGLFVAYTRRDPAYGDTYGAFLTRLARPRVRAARH